MVSMYLAEMYGKIPRTMAFSEDILTSNVFSFFKYANRKLFLHRYLNELGIPVSEKQAQSAQFNFWPTYDDLTEPDLVLEVGDYYILIEAKYTSTFGEGRGDIQQQLIREYHGGKAEAERLGKIFILVAITAHPFYQPGIFQTTPEWVIQKIIWTNWQTITTFLEMVLEGGPKICPETLIFAEDLKNLLIKKHLRSFIGINTFEFVDEVIQMPNDYLFFDSSTAEYGRNFKGFQSILPDGLVELVDFLFYQTTEQVGFFEFEFHDEVEVSREHLFYRR